MSVYGQSREEWALWTTNCKGRKKRTTFTKREAIRLDQMMSQATKFVSVLFRRFTAISSSSHYSSFSRLKHTASTFLLLPPKFYSLCPRAFISHSPLNITANYLRNFRFYGKFNWFCCFLFWFCYELKNLWFCISGSVAFKLKYSVCWIRWN